MQPTRSHTFVTETVRDERRRTAASVARRASLAVPGGRMEQPSRANLAHRTRCMFQQHTNANPFGRCPRGVYPRFLEAPSVPSRQFVHRFGADFEPPVLAA